MKRLKRRKPIVWMLLGVMAGTGSLSAYAQQSTFSLPPTVESGAKLRAVHEDNRFFEGAAWDVATSSLYFTVFKHKVKEIQPLNAQGNVTLWMRDTAGINGMRLARNGRLLAAQAYGHKLLSLKIAPQGPEEIVTLSGDFEGQTYNQPNDLAE